MRHKIYMICALLVITLTTAAQGTKKITGIITDETGEPLIGATVKPASGQGGSVTDFDGNYSISVPADTKQLTVSYIGYQTRTVNIKGNKVDVVMNY